MPLLNTDPSLISQPAPIFQDNDFVRGDHLRANNQAIWNNLGHLLNGDATENFKTLGLTVNGLLTAKAKAIIENAIKLTSSNNEGSVILTDADGSVKIMSNVREVGGVIYLGITGSTGTQRAIRIRQEGADGILYTEIFSGTAGAVIADNAWSVMSKFGGASSSTSVGVSALSNNAGTQNSAFGISALQSNTTGTSNTSVGASSLQSNTTGINNVSIGASSMFANVGGANNTSVGTLALAANVVGTSNVSVGTSALQANTASGNTAVGANALAANTTGTGNTSVGFNAGAAMTTGHSNSIFGSSAGVAINTGLENAIFGYLSANLLTTGQANTVFGAHSGVNMVATIGNSFFGRGSGSSISSGSSNTMVGHNTGTALTTGSNVSCFGAAANPSTATVSNEITLGNASITSLRCAVTTITSLSDRRDKTNILPIPYGLNFIKDLQPVKFTWDDRNGEKQPIDEIGFIAQDLQDVSAKYNADWIGLVSSSNPDRLEASAGKILPILVRSIQELSLQVEQLRALTGI